MQSGSAVAAACRDLDEIEDAIGDWNDADYLRMAARARASALGTDLEPREILNEAVRLVLDGKRPWGHDVSFDAHMTMVMKGIGSNRRRSLRAAKTQPIDDEVDQSSIFAFSEDTPESTFNARQLQALVDTVFDGDALGWTIFMARRVEKMTIEDACEIASIPRDQYETVMKRVNRKLAKAIEAGTIK